MLEPQPRDRTAELMGKLLLTDAEVAELLSITVNGVHYLHRIGKLRGKPVGGTLHWLPHSVQMFVDGLEDDA